MSDTQSNSNPTAEVVMPSAAGSAAAPHSPPAQGGAAANKSKTCERCGKEFLRRVSLKSGHVEASTVFQRRKFCSITCSSKGRKRNRPIGAVAPDKPCANCTKMFGPPLMPNGKPLYPSLFKKRQYCSPICAAIGNAERR